MTTLTRLEPKAPILPTLEESCAHLKVLDAYYATAPNSPLHHDHMCELCFPPACHDCDGPGIRRTSGRQAGTVLCPEDFAARQRTFPSFY